MGLEYHLGGLVIQLYKLLSTQVAWAVRHDCHRYEQACSHCQEEGGRVALEFIRALPDLRAILATDTRAAYEGDPAGSSYDEIIFSYPGLYAITVQRMAHRLWQAEVPLLPPDHDRARPLQDRDRHPPRGHHRGVLLHRPRHRGWSSARPPRSAKGSGSTRG